MRAERRVGHDAAGPPSRQVRRAGRRAVRGRRPRATWPAEVDLLPATIGNPVDRTRGDAARVGALEYGHPVFEPFRAPRSGDFATARIYGYRRCHGRARRRRCWRGSTAASPASSSGASATGACCCGRRRSTAPGATCRSGRSSCRSCIVRCATWPAYKEPQPWLTVGQVLDPSAAASARRPRRRSAWC